MCLEKDVRKNIAQVTTHLDVLLQLDGSIIYAYTV